jgi:hypothetical protein
MAAYPPEDRVDHPDIQSPPTERLVPDTERTLPTSRNTVLVLSFVAVALLIAAIAVAFGMHNATVGLVLAIAAAVVGAIGIMMAYGDARTGMATPILATITAAIVAIIIGFNTSEAKQKIDNTRDNLNEKIVGTPTTVPADPAEIIDPKPEKHPETK